MALVKLEIDGRRVVADTQQTILQVARQHGIDTIPTLCHDDQLDPYSSCFVCVVKVKGARTLLPACSTRVDAGMVVETSAPDVRESRRAALELLLSNHYADCLGPCQTACPAGVDVQGYIALAAIGKYRDAVALIKERNPLPSVCGRVCTRPCEVSGCRRRLLDESVGIDYIKRYLTDLDTGAGGGSRAAAPPATGRRVGVVGAGPGGLSCAYYLAGRGHDVHLFEAQPEAGGMLRYGIPEYRLPKDVLDLEISQILELGVTLRTNSWLGRDFTVASLERAGFEAIFLAIGAWRSSLMRVQDEETPGVLSGIDFLRQVGLGRRLDLSGRVVVVGGGNTAIDCARTTLRLGVSEVRLLYRRTRVEMPAHTSEIQEAIDEGVRMDFLVAPVRVVRQEARVRAIECVRMELGDADASGRRAPRPVHGSEFELPCDWIISAIGQSTTVPDLIDGRIPGFFRPGESLALTRWQTIQVDPRTLETSVEGVFAGGDVVTGAATAIEAIAAGRRAAHAIDTYLTTGVARPEPEAFASRKDTFSTVTVGDLRSGAALARRPMPTLPVEERARSFAEVEQGYTNEDVRIEVQRCLECGCLALYDCRLRRHATDYEAEGSRFLGECRHHPIDSSHPLIELDPNKCILCGRCVRVCRDVVGIAAFGLVNRGFQTIVLPALGGSLLDTGCVSCGLCLGTCPTGAIAQKVPLAKPGPWHTRQVPSVCGYCGVGCRLHFDVYGDTFVKVSRREDSPVTFGNHCRKGRFGFAYVQAADRLVSGKIRPGREIQDAPVEEAIAYAAMRLKELGRHVAGRETAVFVSPRMTNEEIYLAQKLARVALGTHNITSFSRLLNPGLDAFDISGTASYRDLLDAQTILVVNAAPDVDQFVAGLVLRRAVRNGARLIYIGPAANPTSATAAIFLRCAPGTQTDVLDLVVSRARRQAGGSGPAASGGQAPAVVDPDEALAARTGVPLSLADEAADIVRASIIKVVVVNRDYRGDRVAGDLRRIVEAAGTLGCALLPLSEKANSEGLIDMGADPIWLPGRLRVGDAAATERLEKEWGVALGDLDTARPNVAELLRQRRIRVAVILGEDPLGTPGFPADLRAGLLACEFLAVGDLFVTDTAKAAHVVLPLASSAETSGTFTNVERRVQRLRRAVPPRAGLETWEVLCQLAARMGFRFKLRYGNTDEIFAEIRRVAPTYRNVVVDSLDDEGLRESVPAADDGINPGAGAAGSQPAVITPLPTLPLDHLEARFGRWFDRAMADAARRRAAAPS